MPRATAFRLAACLLLWLLSLSPAAGAAHPTDAGATPATPPPPIYETVVTATTPLHGSRLPRAQVPANVQTVTAEAIADQHSLDLSAFMNDNLGGVNINSVQGNPLQPDVQYRGFVASPLLGAPQGLSIYLDGARLNEPFGDVIHWDLVPTNAIGSVNLMPGSNPVFGLNTLGGALSIETKTGFSNPGADASLLYGSFGRKVVQASGGAHGEKFGAFAAAQVFDEDGWRAFSPSHTLNAFVSATYQHDETTADLELMGADTTLTGNGAVPEQLLAIDRHAIFTHPDRTENRLFMALLRAERPLAARLRLSGTAYVRTSRTRSANGDQRDWAPCSAQPGALCSVDDNGTETTVVDRNGQPVAFSAAYDAANNSSSTQQNSYGGATQLAVDAPIGARGNHLFIGAGADEGRIQFRSQSTLASLTPDRGILDTGFLDPASSVAVDSVVRSLGVYASDTFALREDLFLVLSGRLNWSSLSLRDQLGTELTGEHAFHRLNPAVGLSYQPRPVFGLYTSYSESSRAPTPIELTCASASAPCRLPNAFVADPPLDQVVARTFETGVRGVFRRRELTLDYSLSAFRTTNSDDILFVSSGVVANQGYFSNVGYTRRQGLEAGLVGRGRLGAQARVEWSLHYTFTDATFETPFTDASANHPDAVNGLIDVRAGAHLPSIPKHIGKAGLRLVMAFGLSVGVNVVANSSQYFRGDEANLLAPLPGFVVVSLRLEYAIARPISIFALVNNLLDAHYSTFGVLGDAAQALGPTYDSPRFVGPGAPRAAWVGIEVRR